jgi:hypothetical protein
MVRGIERLLPARGDALNVPLKDLRRREQRKTIVVMSIMRRRT